jgi:serine/threonine protein phosphatase 1
MKRYVIGDIHGNYKALVEVLEKSSFNYEEDMLIVIGDVVDGYSCSYQVVEELLKVKNLVFIIGNHDVWWMNHMKNGWAEEVWLMQGGKNTRESYFSEGYNYKKIPEEHRKFFRNGRYYYEIDKMLFVHGGFSYPNHPEKDTIEKLTWDRDLIERCKNGLKIRGWKKIFVGHTTTESQGSKPIKYQGGKNYGELIQIDCGAGWGGKLCIYNIDNDDYFLSEYARILNPNEVSRDFA